MKSLDYIEAKNRYSFYKFEILHIKAVEILTRWRLVRIILRLGSYGKCMFIAKSNRLQQVKKIIRKCDTLWVITSNIVSWEPEGCYCRSKMFHWEPEGRYCHWLCTAIAPFWFSTEHLWVCHNALLALNWQYTPWCAMSKISVLVLFYIVFKETFWSLFSLT